MRIVIVDDETLICRYITKLVQDCGPEYEVVAAENSSLKALETIQRERPDLVFLDITMPQMDGLALLGEIRGIDSRIEVIMLTCHNDFDYVRATMRMEVLDYVLKDEVNPERMRQLLEGAAARIGEKAKRQPPRVYESAFNFARLVRERAGEDCLPDDLAAHNVHLNEDVYFVTVCSYTKQNHAYLQGLAFDGVRNVNLINDDGADIILAANIDAGGGASGAEGPIHKLKRHLADRLDGIVTTGRPYDKTENLYRAIHERLARYDELFYGRAPRPGGPAPEETRRMEKLMRDAVACAGNYEIERMRRLIDEIMELSIESGVDVYTLKHNLFGLVRFNNPAQETAFRRQKIMEAKELGALKATLNEWADELLESTGDGRSQLVHDALRYIHENYMHNLTLAMMSEELHVNADYFSRKFKKEVGINFSKHLLNVRLEEAKNLLTATSLPIMEVAGRVGFHNDSYFSYVFKKALGCTPHDVRKNAAPGQ